MPRHGPYVSISGQDQRKKTWQRNLLGINLLRIVIELVSLI